MEARRKKISCTNGIVGSIDLPLELSILARVPAMECLSKKLFGRGRVSLSSSWCYLGLHCLLAAGLIH